MDDVIGSGNSAERGVVELAASTAQAPVEFTVGRDQAGLKAGTTRMAQGGNVVIISIEGSSTS